MSSAGTVRYTGKPGIAAIYTNYKFCQPKEKGAEAPLSYNPLLAGF
jgi:hypothetical protein